MYKKILLSLILKVSCVQSQILFVGQNENLTINAKTEFSFKNLVFVPVSPFTISNNTLSLKFNNENDVYYNADEIYEFEKPIREYNGQFLVGTSSNTSSHHPIDSLKIHVLKNITWSPLDSKYFGLGGWIKSESLITDHVKALTLKKYDYKGSFKILVNPIINGIAIVEMYHSAELYLLTAEGKLLFKKYFPIGQHKIVMSEYAHGTYILTSGITSQKFIH